MKYDDHDFEMFNDLILLVIVVFLFVLFAAGIGGLVWWFIR